MVAFPDSRPCFLSVDLDDLVVPDTPEHLWDSDSAIDAGTLIDTVVPETPLDYFIPVDVWPSHSAIDYLDCGCPYHGPPPRTTPYYGPPPRATPYNGPVPPATPSQGPPASPIVYSDFETQILAILLTQILDLI